MELLLEIIKYNEYQWCLRGDLKVISHLISMQDSQSTVVFFVSGIVEQYPSITSRNAEDLEELMFLANTASRRILWWT